MLTLISLHVSYVTDGVVRRIFESCRHWDKQLIGDFFADLEW